MYIDPILYKGRPDEARSEIEENCYKLLDSLGVEYFRADHEHADTIEICHQVEKVLLCGICKNLLLTNRQMTEIYLMLMPGDKPFKTKLLSKQIGTARLSFASAEQMMEHLKLTPGSVSVLGLMNDSEKKVHLIIDRDLMKEEYFGCHPCLNSSTIKFKTTDLTDTVLPALGYEPEYVELPWEVD